jgi:hypothetical protein
MAGIFEIILRIVLLKEAFDNLNSAFPILAKKAGSCYYIFIYVLL